MSTMIDGVFAKSVFRTGAVRPAFGVLLAVTVCASLGLATTSSAQTPPQPITQSLPKDTEVAGPARTTLLFVDLSLRAGETLRVVGQVEAIMKSTNYQSIDDTIAVQCAEVISRDPEVVTGDGALTETETSLVPGIPIRLRPILLFTAPHDGPYRCELMAQVDAGTTETVMTALEELTYLAVSAADAVGSHSWQGPTCDSQGNLCTCTYLGPNEQPQCPNQQRQSVLVFHDDGSPLSTWTAAADVTAASVTASVELTTCRHTASCGGRRGDDDTYYSMVQSRLEAVQLGANGQPCNVTASSWRTDRVDDIPHHANIPYSLRNVPVLATCGSRDFYVDVAMQWVGGNPVKIDGSSPDPHLPETMTNAFIVATAHGQTTTVPRVIDLTPDAAQPVLTAAQLTLGTVTDVESFALAGTIVAQLAAPGTVEPIGSPVNLFVSLGTASFTGYGTASKPPTALSLALSRARSQATAAGFPLTHCQQTDQSVELNQNGTYDASVTLTCSRQL